MYIHIDIFPPGGPPPLRPRHPPGLLLYIIAPLSDSEGAIAPFKKSILQFM